MKLSITHKNKTLSLDVKSCNWLQKFTGLMFSRREKAEALLLMDFKRPVNFGIHSFFVFFPFFAVWLDDKNKIIDLKIVKPFTSLVHSKKSFHKLVEIPINERYKKIVSSLDAAKDLKT